MLRAAHRVLRPGGRIAFFVIEHADDVPAERVDELCDHSPRATTTDRGYPDLLAEAGFTGIGGRDVSEAYRETHAAWLATSEPVLDQLGAVDGVTVVTERIATWRAAQPYIDRGWLRRGLYWAAKPRTGPQATPGRRLR